MKKKIFRSITLCSLVMILICTSLIMLVLYGFFEKRIMNDITEEIRYLSEGVESGGLEYLNEFNNASHRITLIDQNGKVIYDNRADINTLESHADREEFIKAKSQGESSISRFSDTLMTKTMYHAKRLHDNSVLRVAVELNSIFGYLLDLLPSFVIIIAVVLVLSFLLSGYLSKRIILPINELDLDHPEENEAYDELSPLLLRIKKQHEKIDEQLTEMRRSQTEFGLITDCMDEGLLVIDRNTCLLSYNRSALRLLDVDDAVLNTGVFTLNRSREFRIATETALSGKNAVRELVINGCMCQIMASPVIHDGEITGAVIIILDVTEREQREQLRREFTANVSHELKTPLTTIYGVSDMISEGMVKPEDIPGFAKNIRSEASRLISLTEDIIKLSELDENVPTGNFEDVNMTALARTVVSRLNELAATRNISLNVKGYDAYVSGSPAILDELLFNLCENAVKYNKDNGRVDIEVSSDSNSVTITVTDTGIGIPAADRERVFERFYRVDKSHSKRIGGTGLGLSIVKHAVLYHGGNVSLESTEGVGTRVTVILPTSAHD